MKFSPTNPESGSNSVISPENTSPTLPWRKVGAGVLAGFAFFHAKNTASDISPISSQTPEIGLTAQSDKSTYDDGNLDPRNYDLFSPEYLDVIKGRNSFLSGDVTVNGFDVVINFVDIQKRLAPDQVIKITVHDESLKASKQEQSSDVITKTNIDATASVVHPTYGDGLHTTLGNFDSSDRLISKGYENLFGGLTATRNQSLGFKRYRLNGTKTPILLAHSKAKIEFKPNTECEGVPERIVSEIKLSDSNHQRLCRYLARITGIVPNGYLFFVDYIDSRFDVSDSVMPKDKTLTLDVPFQNDEHARSPEYATTLHEAMHAAFFALPLDSPIFPKLINAYVKTLESSKHGLDMSNLVVKGYNVTENEPVWAAVTESTYEKSVLGYKESSAGHPWDNITEMASSTSAVMAIYPKELVTNYNDLSKKQRKAVKSVVKATLFFIRNIAPDNDIAHYIPGYRYLMDNLDIKSLS